MDKQQVIIPNTLQQLILEFILGLSNNVEYWINFTAAEPLI